MSSPSASESSSLEDSSIVSMMQNGTLPSGQVVAASAVQRLVAMELHHAGFDSANADALDELEGIVAGFFESLVQHAHELAEHGRRTRPTIKDVVQATGELGVAGITQLEQEILRTKAQDDQLPMRVKYERNRVDRSEPVLASDDEDLASSDDNNDAGAPRTTTRVNSKKRPRVHQVLEADYLPPLPAKHSYKQTPVFPIPAQPPAIPPSAFHTEQSLSAAAEKHLSTLRARLNDSQLVASSLRNLIRKTSARAAPTSTSSVGATWNSTGQATGTGLDSTTMDLSTTTPAVVMEEDADVVDYEGEWYGGQEPAPGGERSVIVLRIAPDGTTVDPPGVTSSSRGAGATAGPVKKGFGAEWSDAGRVGSTAKRRKWREGGPGVGGRAQQSFVHG